MADSTAGACTEHWWAIEGDEWVCSLCGKSEKVQPPDYVSRLENALAALGAIGSGYCFCRENRDPDKSDHEPECEEARSITSSPAPLSPAVSPESDQG